MSKTPETIGELYRTLKNQVGNETRFRETEELVTELIEDDESGRLVYETGRKMNEKLWFTTLTQILFEENGLFGFPQQNNSLERLNKLENFAAHSEVILTNHPDAAKIQRELSKLVSLLIYYEQGINQAQEVPITR